MDDTSRFYPDCHRLLEVLREKRGENQPALVPMYCKDDVNNRVKDSYTW